VQKCKMGALEVARKISIDFPVRNLRSRPQHPSLSCGQASNLRRLNWPDCRRSALVDPLLVSRHSVREPLPVCPQSQTPAASQQAVGLGQERPFALQKNSEPFRRSPEAVSKQYLNSITSSAPESSGHLLGRGYHHLHANRCRHFGQKVITVPRIDGSGTVGSMDPRATPVPGNKTFTPPMSLFSFQTSPRPPTRFSN
jgi:hypothetical protein